MCMLVFLKQCKNKKMKQLRSLKSNNKPCCLIQPLLFFNEISKTKKKKRNTTANIHKLAGLKGPFWPGTTTVCQLFLLASRTFFLRDFLFLVQPNNQ